jgi:transcriptional regulator with XRE-family HTH domain
MLKKLNRIYEIRLTLGLTQAELGKRLGVTKNYIYLIESGRKPLSQKILDLAEMLLAQYDPKKPADIPVDPLAQLRAELAECKAQLKQAHATIAVQARTIASLHAASAPKN